MQCHITCLACLAGSCWADHYPGACQRSGSTGDWRKWSTACVPLPGPCLGWQLRYNALPPAPSPSTAGRLMSAQLMVRLHANTPASGNVRGYMASQLNTMSCAASRLRTHCRTLKWSVHAIQVWQAALPNMLASPADCF